MPTVFISYSWDSAEHREWVRRFAADLRAEGVDARLDQWELQLGDDVTQFMERGVAESDFVFLICTENFARKANERHGGVGYEQAIVTAELLGSQRARGRFVCVLREGTPSSALPTYMKARLWVDCRDDGAYAEAVKQLVHHVLRRSEEEKPPLGSIDTALATDAAMDARSSGSAAPPGVWSLVAGTGTPRGFSAELEAMSAALGAGLMDRRCGLVTGGWPGVDEWVARGFSSRAVQSRVPLEDFLVQVLVDGQEPIYTAGQLVFVDRGDEEWDEPLRRADVAILLGGLGGTATVGSRALRMRKPVLPVADSGGDAKSFYLDMLKRWSELNWTGISQKEFQRLGRPGMAGIEAALELALKVRARGA